jgi:hypothetical protein
MRCWCAARAGGSNVDGSFGAAVAVASPSTSGTTPDVHEARRLTSTTRDIAAPRISVG